MQARAPHTKKWHVSVTGLVTALVVSLIIGALASLVLPGNQPIPVWPAIVVGALGAVLGTSPVQNLGVAVAPPLYRHGRES